MQNCHHIHQVNNTQGKKEKAHTSNFISQPVQVAVSLLLPLLPHCKSLWFAVLLSIRL